MLLAAAFSLLLQRYGGQTDICLGYPVANRGHSQIEGLIGFFVNTLVLRTRPDPAQPFSALLAQVREAVLQGDAHQDVPFEKLVEELRPQRSLSHPPLFQAMLSYNNNDEGGLDLPGLALRPLEAGSDVTKFELTLGFAERAGELLGSLEYNADLFDRTTIERMEGHLRTLLEAVVADPEQPLAHLPILTAAERRKALVEWNGAPLAFPAGGVLHERFAAQAVRYPDAVAVADGHRALSYAQLDARANQLAHHLRGLGVGPGTLVPLCFERSLETIVALLGVLKAGGAYVPLDPEYPHERLAYMLADTAAPVLLTQALLLDRLPDYAGALLCLDRDWAAIARRPSTAPPNEARPHDVAYCIYTSGSTGKPKGVLVTHHNALRLFAATDAHFGFGPADVWSLFHSYAFDFSVWEIFGALLHGGKLVVVPRLTAKAPDAFVELIDAHGVTVLNQTPSAFRQLIAQARTKHDASSLRSLRHVIFGGEALDPTALAPWVALFGDERPVLTNMYGITETTVHVTQRVVRAADTASATSPIGRAIADLQLYVLDPGLNPVPVGTPGELYVGGAGLARGYLNRPGLTAERFIPHPFSRVPGARLYRTGDRAKYRADGEIDYLGRLDDQVKLRGYRIELGEIESALAAHPGVREAAVIAGRDGSGEASLSAFFVPHPGAAPDIPQLRAYLRTQLPEYMIPAAILRLEALPITANGKLDRKALAQIERAPEERRFVAPRTPVEQALAEIWQDVLGVEAVSTGDDFFDLGGHSLAVVKIVSRVNALLDIELRVRKFYEHPTVAALAEHVLRCVLGDEDGSDEPFEWASTLAKVPWVDDGAPLPDSARALGEEGAAWGLLAAGGTISPERLEEGARKGIFPLYNEGNPVMWWAPERRMVLPAGELRLVTNMRRILRGFARRPEYEIRVDTAFDQVLEACATMQRKGQDGRTWILPEMARAYRAWHAAGAVHSFETWMDGELVGGLFAIGLGRMAYIESMFARRTDASKIALAAFVAFCRRHGIELIDLQLYTPHLESMGGRLIPRADFERHLVRAVAEAPVPELALRARHVGRAGAERARPARNGESLMAAPVPEAVAKMSLDQLRRLRAQVSGGRNGDPENAPLAAEARPAVLPLAYAQEGLWFLDRLGLVGEAYTLPVVVRVNGALDAPALERALSEVVRRHEALRTRFQTVDGAGAQVIDPPAPVALERHDLSALDEPARAERARDWIEERIAHRFDLERETPLRAGLLRLGPAEHVLLIVMHHIAADGWSIRILLRELDALYAAFAAGRPSPLPELPAQYADFALRQRRTLQGGTLEKHLAYWRARLSGAPESLDLPTDRVRPPRPSFRGAVVSFALAPELAAGLLALARRHDMTPFMLLLAVWQTLLARWSGQSDVIVGTPTAGRGRRETEELIGLFVNTLVLRADLSSDPRFSALLAETRSTVLDAYEHADLPFDKLVAELRPTRDLSRQPLFQVGYVYQGGGAPDAYALGGLPLSAVEIGHTTAKFDLSLYVTENGSELDGGIEYATDLFERATIERLVEHLRTLLEAVVADPERRLSDLPLLGPAERRRVLEWNPGRAAFPAGGTLHERVAAQAARRPDAVAVEHEGRTLTYAELNARANQLAHHLRGLGVGPGTLVPLCFERSPDMIVALLAVLKAGGAYVPLDPQYPPERLAYMLADVASPVLLTQTALLEHVPQPAPATAVVCVDRDESGIARWPDTDPANHTRPHDVAYCIYTSGSTGKPKGVLVTHHNALRLFAATAERFAFGSADVWSLFHSYAFDFSVWEIFGALLHGGKLVIVPLLTAKSPEAFIELIDEHGVTVLNQTPSAFRQLVAAVQANRDPGSSGQPLPVRSLRSLRRVIFGGEALDPSSLAPWVALFGDERPVLTNMYGITETTVHVTQRDLRAADTLDTANSPIGHAIADLQLYVLDAHLNPVPIGTPGELYVGGAGLARGYLNRPDLTAERFVPHPFSRVPGARLYRTGDRAKYRADGEIDYLGRVDDQVKLRGYRIELGEIEACLREAGGVREAVVLVTGSRETQERLAAWLVPRARSGDDPHAAAALDLQAVRAHLSARLPQFMVPADIVVLDALPLTANGKLDRAALRALTRRERALGDAPAAPLNAGEEVLGMTFEAALGVPVGRDDNFFALGGDSMLAVRVAHDVARHGLAVSVAAIFEHQTVAAIVRAAAGAAAALPAPAPLELLPRLDRSGSLAEFEDVYPLTTMQELMQQAYADNRVHGLGIFHAQQWFRVRDPGCSADAMERAAQILVDRHPVLRTRFVTARGRLWQGIRSSDRVPFTRHDLRGLDDAERRRFVDDLLLADRADPLAAPDADVSPLRFHWCALDDDTFVLLMSIHHAVDDGWGNQYFLTWLFDLYARIKAGEPVPVERASNVFKEYVALEHELRGSLAAAAFWRERRLPRTGAALLAREPDAPPARDGTTRYVGGGVVSRMYATTRRLGVSLKAIALSAYLELLEREVLAQPVTVATVANGRSDRLSDPLSALGLFWNLAPVCVPSGGSTREHHLSAVQRELVALEPHAVYPLTGIAAPDDIAALFFATFNFVNFHNAYRESPEAGLRIEEAGGLDKFPYPLNLHVAVDRERDELFVHANYDSAYFSTARVEALLRRYAELLEERLHE